MTNAEQLESMRVVHEALSANPPRLDVAEMIFRSIPGCEDVSIPLPSADQLEQAILLRARIDSDRADAKRRDAENAKDNYFDDGPSYLAQLGRSLDEQRKRLEVEILEAGGTREFVGLFNVATGERVPAKVIDTQYGESWMLCDAVTGRATGVFFKVGRTDEDGKPVNSKRSKLVKAGYEERIERAPAKAITTGVGRGTGGSAWVTVIRTDGGWPGAPEWRGKEGR